MALLGPDFRAGLNHALYRPFNPAGLWSSIAIFVGLLLVNQFVLVWVFATVIDGLTPNEGDWTHSILLSLLPSGLVTACLCLILARQREADPRDVLALRFPALGVLGWIFIVGGFVLAINLLFYALALLFQLDLNSSGIVEQGAMQYGNDPLYFVIAGGLVFGAPVAEEFLFRGQLFAALAQTPLGIAGASVITSSVWALMHGLTEPLYVVALLFVMGLALCWLLVRFGSLWVTIACHAAWNAIQAYVLYALAPQ
jgi:membrane protease YdiL (CAAX protease family)